MKTNYFLLTEDSESTIGVVGASSNEELIFKSKIAVSQHFDIDIPSELIIDMEDCLYGREGEFSIKIAYDGDEDYLATISVQQVFLY